MKKFFLLCAFIPSLCGYAYSDVKVMGNADTYHAVQVKDPYAYMSSRTSARVDAQFTMDDTLAFISIKGEKNNVVETETGVEVREAYAEYVSEHFELRGGRQLIIWGKADGFQITDIICPKDYTEFLARDFDEMRIAVDGMKAGINFDPVIIQLVWLPVFQPAEFPGEESPWRVEQYDGNRLSVRNYDACEPEHNIKNSEGGGRISVNLPGIDFGFSYFYTWSDSPSLHNRGLTGTDLEADMEYHRLSFYGAEFSIPAGDFVLRGESAFYTNCYYEQDNYTEEPLKKNNVKGLAGVDWTPGGNWTVSVQVYEDYICGYVKDLQQSQNSVVSTLRIEKKLFREQFTLTTMLFYGFNDRDCFDRTSADFALSDALHVLAGFDIFAGSEDGDYGRYSDNSEVWGRMKYSF